MFELKGKYSSATIYTDNIDNSAIGLIQALCNQEFTRDSKIKIMPDVHAGKGCCIGTTMTIKDKVVPNLVGVDIGCGMLTVKLKEKRLDLPKLDSVIKKSIPSGGDVNETYSTTNGSKVENLRCLKDANIKLDRAYASLGTLGGGNHFIEIDKSDNGDLYLVIHTGSRHLGLEVCNYYQNKAYEQLKEQMTGETLSEKQAKLIKQLKWEGRHKEISRELAKLKKEYHQLRPNIPFELAYCSGGLFDDYIHDMKITQEHASINRALIAKRIIKEMKLHEVERFETIHNYIDTENMVLRKGAISARLGEKVLIPINMRDGAIIAVGKGNDDWNQSAPHGAGRLFSRSQAKRSFTVSDFKKTMKDAGVYSSSVNEGTLDESPMAYKPIKEILDKIVDTVDVIEQIKPIYNFKSV